MTNQNCLACHQPMHEGEGYYACHNDNCFFVDKEIKKYQWSSRPAHPLEKKVEKYRDYLINNRSPINPARVKFQEIFGTETEGNNG